jgi:hypothetical protein
MLTSTMPNPPDGDPRVTTLALPVRNRLLATRELIFWPIKFKHGSRSVHGVCCCSSITSIYHFTMVKLVVLAAALVAAVSASCTDDAGCSLNGLCNTATGTCTCDPGWITGAPSYGSPDCGMLDLLAAPSDVSFHGKNDNQSSWGGSVLNLPVNGKMSYVTPLSLFSCSYENGRSESRFG